MRTPLALVALGLALALAGCGGGSESKSSTEPLIPRAVAADLAAKSDAIADALEAGDQCGAAQLADQLRDAVEAYVAGGRVPPAYQQELTATAIDLQNDVNCEPEEEEHGNEDKGKKKGHDKDDETTTVEITTDTTTEED